MTFQHSHAMPSRWMLPLLSALLTFGLSAHPAQAQSKSSKKAKATADAGQQKRTTFDISRIAILDIFALAFMLLGFYCYFTGHSYFSALSMALSAVSKETGVAGFAIIAVVQVFRCIRSRGRAGIWNTFFTWFERYLITFAACSSYC